MNKQSVVPNKENVEFNKDKFNNLIDDKGYQCYWEKALICPCRKDITTQAQSDCINCNGFGFYYLQKTKILGNTVSIFSKYGSVTNWSEVLEGTAQFTTKAENKIGWMDRITILGGTSSFSQLKEVSISGADKIVSLHYVPVEIKNVFKFVNEETPLLSIPVEDITIEENSNIVIINNVNVADGNNLTFLYEYYPQYLVIDHLHEFRNFRKGNQSYIEDRTNKLYPIQVLIKKSHLITNQ